MSPRQRRYLSIAAVAIGAPVLVLLFLLALVQTPPGKRMIAGLVEDMASSADQRIRLAGLRGFVPFDMSVEKLEIADGQGVWLVAQDVAIDWSPLAMLGDHLQIERLQAAAIEVTRRPIERSTPKKPDDEGAGSGLPRRIDIGAVEVGKLTLGPALAGETAQYRLTGNARVAGLKEDNWLVLKANRSDGGDGVLDLNGRYDGKREVLEIKLIAHEGAATVNRFSQLDGKQGIDMRADIAGPLGDLNGTLKIDAGELLQVDGKVRAEQRDGGTQATLSLTGRAGTLGVAPWLEALRGDWSLQANGSFAPTTITLRSAELQGPPGKLVGSGEIDRRDDTGELTFTLDAASAAFAKLLPGASWQTLNAKGRLNGKLMQPAVTAVITGETLKLDDVSIGGIAINLDGAAQTDQSRTATLKAEIENIVLPIAGNRRLTTRATITASAAQPRNQPVAIRDFKLVSPVLTADGAGQYDPDRNMLSGTIKAAAADLAVFAEALNQDIAGKLDLQLETKDNGDVLAVALDSTLENGRLPGVPPQLLAPKLTVALRATLPGQQAWRVQSLTLESDAGSISASGEGQGLLGKAVLDWRLADIAAIDAQLKGKSEGRLEISASADATTAKLRGSLSEAKIDVADVPRLVLELDATRANRETSGRLAVDGTMQTAPIKGGGDFLVGDDGRAVIRDFDLRWASISAVGKNFTIGSEGTTGELTLKAGKLQELNPFLPAKLAGSLDATLKAVEARKVHIAATAQGLRVNDDVALDQLRLEGDVVEPLGRAAFTLTASANGPKLAGPLRQATLKANGEKNGLAFNIDGTGEKLRATAQGKAAIGATDTTVDLQSMTAVYAAQTVALAAPARLRFEGGRTTIERASLRAGNGTVTANGTLGPASNLDVQGRGLPLQLLQAFDPELQIFGVSNFTAKVTGPIAQPKVDLTLDASDMRLRTIRTAGIPPGALNAKATVQNGIATIEGRFTAGAGNTLNFSGAGPLPDAKGVSNGRLRLEGGVRLAQLTPFLSGKGRLNGDMAIDLTLTATNGAIGGDGTIRIIDGRYFNLADGIAIRDIDATFALVGDRLEVRSFSAKPKQGEVVLSGYVRVDPQFTLPMDLGIVMRSARVFDRRDLEVTVSADLRLNGSLAEGMSLNGATTVERADLNLAENVDSGPDIANIQVREINRPGGAPDQRQQQRAKLPGPEVRLAIKVNAPQNVFVRGRGLDVEMGGTVDVGGTISQPRIDGALRLRRGTFSGTGRRMEFTRGTVTFPDPNKLEPVIDFTATARIEAGTAEIQITGSPSAPKVNLTSSPPLPRDEIMAQLLFGRATSQLSPLQLAEIAQSAGTLSGMTGSGGGILDTLRKALGFDRLAVSSDPKAQAAGSSPLGGSSLEAGRNIAPGVYIGAKQGANTGSSAAVVEIELTPNIKVQSEVGTDARSKVGVTMEWDY